MLTETLAALAAAGGAAIMEAAAGDVWRAAKTSFAKLLGRGNDERTAVVEQQLEASRSAIEANPAESAAVAQTQRSVWTARLEDLLLDDPGRADELTKLVNLYGAGSQSTAGNVRQTVIGHDNAQQAVLGHGQQHNTFGTPPAGPPR
ncbi:MAG: hypothetical protein ABW022_03730 [Actinoplanes sp.]